MPPFTVEKDSYLSCDLKPIPGYDKSLMYDCKFVKKVDIMRAVATDAESATFINIDQEKIKNFNLKLHLSLILFPPHFPIFY